MDVAPHVSFNFTYVAVLQTTPWYSPLRMALVVYAWEGKNLHIATQSMGYTCI
jgi:hypothetical protein